MQSTISIGKLVATFGLKGEFVLSHGLGRKSDLKNVKILFLEMQRGSFLPYFLEQARVKSMTESWVKLEGIDTKEQAAKLLQKQVWIDEALFNELVDSTATMALLGYTIVDGTKELGLVSEVLEQPHQVICSVQIGQKEALIPLNESTLVKIDRKKRKIFVELPDGLLAVYLD